MQSEEFDGEQIPKATVLYDGKYKYSCTLIVEEDDGSDLDGYDWYMDIEPLKSKTFYYYAELPKEAKEDGNIKIRFEGKLLWIKNKIKQKAIDQKSIALFLALKN